MQFYRGGVDILETVKIIISVAMVFWFLNWGGGASMLYQGLTEGLEKIAAAVLAGSALSGDTTTMIGAMGDNILEVADMMMGAGITKIGIVLDGLILFLMTVFALAIAVIYLAVCKVAIAITMLFFPLFLAFFIFPATRQYFYSWVNVMLSFMFTYLLMIAIVSFSLSSIYTIMDEGFKDPHRIDIRFVNTIGVLVNHLVLIVLMLQVRGWAASLTQGLGPSGAGGRAASFLTTVIKAKIGMK